MSRRLRRLATIGLLAAFPACGVDGLSFVRDEQVEIVAPADRSVVTLPFAISWTSEAVGEGESFAVFIDRAPQPPGEPLAWLARDDDQCRVAPGCPDEAYFTAKNVYATPGNTVTIERLQETRPSDQRRFRDLHEAVVVLLDERGRRVGESAFAVEFELRREAN